MKNIITISAPSGTGKTTLCKAVQDEIPDVKWSVSFTTREKRVTEKNGVDYKFISVEKFKKLIQKKFFLEWEKVHGNYYGTSYDIISDTLNNNKMLLIETDVKGAISIKKLYPLNTFAIFIMPPSLNDARNRLKNRGTDSIERINIRLERFQKEMDYVAKFDAKIINKDLDIAKDELIKTINSIKKGD